MKKLFLLIPALILSMMMNATETNVNAGAGTLSTAISNAAAGDVLVLANGEFTESSPVGIDKSLVIKAANEATPILKIQFGIQGGARVEFRGINFDASVVTSHLIYANDATAGNKLILEGCELYGDTANSALIHCSSNKILDACTINNCYFHNITKSCFFNENTDNAIDIKVTNSTFANISTASKYYAGVIDSRATSGSFNVDHCTFYNVHAMSTDYAAVGKVKLASGAVVSNCIFAFPTSASSSIRTIRDKVTASNNLVYNYTADSNYGMQSDVTKINCVKDQDPLFNNAAEESFTLSTSSPAVMASTNGTPLGAKKWWPTLTFPTTDFASTYTFAAADAKLMGEIRLNTNSHIEYYNKSVCGQAVWKIHPTKACAVQTTLNMESGSSSGHIFKVSIYDADGNSIGSVEEPSYSDKDGNILLKEGIFFPAAGDYYVVLNNIQEYSSAKIEGITLSYVGGAVQNIPATTDISEAWYSARGTRADDMISFDSYTNQWVKWLVAVPGTMNRAYDVTLTINNPTEYGHNFSVAFYEIGAEEPVATVSEKSWNQTYGDALALSLGSVELMGGKNYILKVTNAESGAQPKVISVSFAYSGGNVQNMPGTTNIADSWFSPNGTRADGKITYSNISGGCWAKWNIAVANAGTYNVTVNIQNQYGHNYVVEFLKEGNTTPISVFEGGTTYGHDATLYPVEVGTIALEAGNYVMTVSNNVGDAKLLSTTLTYAGGASIDLSKNTPANLLANADAILSDDWSIEGGKITHAESKATTGWAKWNVECADAGTYNVKVNISSDNGHLVRVEVFEGDAVQAIDTLDETSTTKYATGNQTIDLGNVDLSSRDYVIKVSNTLPNSHVQIASIIITYAGGATITIPNASIPFNEALLYNGATRDLVSEPQQIHFGSVDAYAQWNIHAAAGIYTFTFDVVGTNYGTYKLDINQGNTNIFTDTKGKQGSGTVSISNVLILEEGDYELKMANTNSGADGYLTSLTASADNNIFIINENETDPEIIAGKAETSWKALLQRTFKGGVYNSFCIPVEPGLGELGTAFGAGYELLELESATLDGGVLNLNFTAASGVSAGKPYLIKPVADVANPVFNAHNIHNYTYNNTQSVGVVDFIGNFVKKTIDASENNLYLGADDKLYFSNNDVTIKGLRAYFKINVPNPAQAIKRARIVTPHNMPTEIDLVGAENQTLKTIENGQLIIFRDGKKYNVMGIRL